MTTPQFHLTPLLSVFDARSARQRRSEGTTLDVSVWMSIVDGLRAVDMSDDDIEARIRFAVTGSLLSLIHI